jgi:hypothetical protein
VRDLHLLDIYRRTDPKVVELYGSTGDEASGVFSVPSPTDGRMLMIIASSGEGWDHVSVSHKDRCPTWPEMEHIKRLFFKDDETAMQLHVPVADHINVHQYVLHIWRPLEVEIPRPPAEFVA